LHFVLSLVPDRQVNFGIAGAKLRVPEDRLGGLRQGIFENLLEGRDLHGMIVKYFTCNALQLSSKE